MKFEPLHSDRPLIVYVDFKSPYAFIAVRPTFQLAESLGIAIDWRPLTLDIPSFAGSARLDSSGRVAESQRTPGQWSFVKYSYHDARRYARLTGFPLRGTVKIWDTTLAGMGLLWAKRGGDSLTRRYLETAYDRFWRRELDVEDVGVIESLLRELGADPTGFREWIASGRDEYLADQETLFEAGVFGVPGYVVEGEYYWGREHLPRIRWILTGRRGPAPDVAYQAVASHSA